VLGDLSECSPTTRRYVANLASILPRVVWSQVRRRATIGFILANASVTGIALVICLGLRREPFFVEPWALLRAAAPLAIWVVGCALAAAYGPRERPEQWHSRIFFSTPIFVLVAAWAAGVPIAGVALALGGVVGVFVLLAFPALKYGMPPPLSLDTLPVHARLFQTQIRWRNGREALAGLAVVLFNVNDLFETATLLERTTQVLLVTAPVFVILFLYLRAGARRVPATSDRATLLEFHLREIARQREVLLTVPLWYLLPFVPGAVLSVISRQGATIPGVVGALGVIAVLFAVIGWMNRAGARFLDGQLQQVQALEGQQ
jgi:hypothetical protein